VRAAEHPSEEFYVHDLVLNARTFEILRRAAQRPGDAFFRPVLLPKRHQFVTDESCEYEDFEV
jgi:hypothetical protein